MREGNATRLRAFVTKGMTLIVIPLLFAACANPHGAATNEVSASASQASPSGAGTNRVPVSAPATPSGAFMMAAQNGNGFVCSGLDDGTIGCACNPKSDDIHVYTCNGMRGICKVLGGAYRCPPGEALCYCNVNVKQ